MTAAILHRMSSIDRASARSEDDTGDYVVELSLASSEPYERWWGVEVLDCAPESVRLGRLNDGGAVLYNHNWNDLRGVHVPGTVRCEDEKVRAEVRLTGATEAGREAVALVRSDVLTKTSVGYEIHKVIEQTTSKSGEAIVREIDGRAFSRVLTRSQAAAPGDVAAFRRALDAHAGPIERAKNEPAIYRVVDWEPLETSLVTVPADPSVGVGRTVEIVDPAPVSQPEPSPKEVKMSDPVIDVAAVQAAATEAAQRRTAEILAHADAFKDWAGVPEMARQALVNGEPVEVFTKRLLEHIGKTGKRLDPSIGMTDTEARRFSIVKAIRAMVSGDWSQAGFEREASNAAREVAQRNGAQSHGTEKGFFLPVEVQRRDLTVGTATAGGNMVATNLRPQDFIELLRNQMVLRDLGMRTLSGLVGNADITRQTGAATAYWLANEATAITESQQTVGLLQLRPKVVGAYTEVSRLLMQQSTPDADAFVQEDLAKVLALGIDLAGISGSGASGQPTGILNTAGIGAFTGTTLGLAGLMNAQEDVAGANALVDGCAYLTTPAVASLLAQRQKFASTDTPLWVGNILRGEVLGFRARASNQMSSATAIFGDFSQVILAEWGVLEIDINPYANFAAGITGIRAFYTCDIGVRIAGAFSAASTIT